MAFIMKQRGQKETFTIIVPEIQDAVGNETGTVLVNGVHAVGDTTIAVDGHNNDGTHKFKAGDFIKFASHSKVYMIVADVTSSSQASTITIEPPLLVALANDSVVTYDNIPFTVSLTSDIQEFGVSGTDNQGKLYYEYQFDVEEAL